MGKDTNSDLILQHLLKFVVSNKHQLLLAFKMFAPLRSGKTNKLINNKNKPGNVMYGLHRGGALFPCMPCSDRSVLNT